MPPLTSILDKGWGYENKVHLTVDRRVDSLVRSVDMCVGGCLRYDISCSVLAPGHHFQSKKSTTLGSNFTLSILLK